MFNLILSISPEFLVLLMVLVVVGIALIAYRFNYTTQIRVSLYMDNEPDVFNKKGIVKYIQTRKRKLKDPILVCCYIENLETLYNTNPNKKDVLVQITDALLCGLDKVESVGRINFNKFIIVYSGKKISEIKEFVAQIDERLNAIVFEKYGQYSFYTKYGINEKIDLSKIDAEISKTAAILSYSNVIEKNMYFDCDQVNQAISKFDIINDMKDSAFELHQFVPYVQPKVSLRTGKIIGGEVLVRWVNSSGEILYSPADFIPLFESNGFIKKIDFEMFEQACIVAQTLCNRGYRDIVLSVNFSKMNFDSLTFIEDLTKVISKYNISPNNIEIEITETTAMASQHAVSTTITKLKNLGYKLAMDDFGKEYSSLGSLSKNPFDTIKMDMVFFENSLRTEREQLIAQNVLNMLSRLDCEIVCEGVRDKETIDTLAKMTLDVIIQGYSISKPIPVNEFYNFVNSKFDFKYAEPNHTVMMSSGTAPQQSTYVDPNDEVAVLRAQIDEMKALIKTKAEKKKREEEIKNLQAELAEMRKLASDEDQDEVASLKEELASLKTQVKSSPAPIDDEEVTEDIVVEKQPEPEAAPLTPEHIEDPVIADPVEEEIISEDLSVIDEPAEQETNTENFNDLEEIEDSEDESQDTEN